MLINSLKVNLSDALVYDMILARVIPLKRLKGELWKLTVGHFEMLMPFVEASILFLDLAHFGYDEILS